MKILACPVQAAGHMNALIGLCQALHDRNHQIYYVIEVGFVGKLKKYGFEEVVLKNTKNGEEPDLKAQNPVKYLAEKNREIGMLQNRTSMEKAEAMMKNDQMFEEMMQQNIDNEPQMRQVIVEISPDLILVDNITVLPCIIHGQIPWVFVWSAQPLLVYNTRKLPPPLSGFPTNMNNSSSWNEFFQITDEWDAKILKNQNIILAQFGYPAIKWKSIGRQSPYLNIYAYPEELDYHEIMPRPEKVLQIDAFSRYNPEPYEIPEELKAKIKLGDKLIYISMGSMGSIDTDLMKRVTGALKDTPHWYIVSKGLLADEYDLPENMWGKGFLPQTSILPLVDLVITHGGNNSTTETICAGKPMIVMPLFADQFDNAQRVQEKGLGIRIEPYQFEPSQLVEAVDQLLKDYEIQLKAKQVSERIAKTNSKQRACVALEELAVKRSRK